VQVAKGGALARYFGRTGWAAPGKDVSDLNNNRGNNNNNRRRGRTNNRPQGGGGQQLNRIDSRARGNAPQMLEKYRKQAQDAHLNGDRVQAEYYLQFADHYFRVIADSRVRPEDQRPRQAGGPTGDRWSEGEAEDDTMEYGMDADFAGFDRQGRRDERDAPREQQCEQQREQSREQPREQQRDPQRDHQREVPRDNQRDANREERDGETRERDGSGSAPRDPGERSAGEPRDKRDSRSPREPREQREPREPREPYDDRRPRAEPASPQVAPVEMIRAAEGEPVGDADANPFVRDNRGPRGLRPRREGRAPREAEVAPTVGLDPSILPPAIGIRAEPEPAADVDVPVDAAFEGAETEAPAPKRRGRTRKTPLPEAAAPAEG